MIDKDKGNAVLTETLSQEIRRTLQLALAEDHAENDVTSQACLPPVAPAKATLLLKQPGRIAGLVILPILCQLLDNTLDLRLFVEDGCNCNPGAVLATLEGNARSILAGERSALNLIQHASGIATTTAAYVDAVKGFSCDILDTRKTLPGLRAIQKYAVLIGGGKNHRFHLEDRFLIKDNHIKLLKETTSTPVAEAVRRAKILQPGVKVEVEVSTLAMLEEALSVEADVVLLDNMSASLVAEAVKLNAGKVYLEASGGIGLEEVARYAATGVNGISIGALTHSVRAIDMSLKV
ncbi:MAG: carboxylating nicotinate-nucleotide diphosphorylase [Verrucomicrobia bacterium]|nr:carboxylating nicotinate-nucleotide diphosphorylase [Verrucomicrobiota bacterium]